MAAYHAPVPELAPTTAPPLALAGAWGGTGHLIDLPGPHPGPVHWVDFGGPAQEQPGSPAPTPVVFVHGLGGSHLNWVGLGPRLSRQRPAYALDLAGFGLTPGDKHASEVGANAELVARFIREVVGLRCILVGNSMGGLISLLVAGRHPDLVERLVLIDPAIPSRRRAMDRQVAATFLAYQIPRVGEMVTRRVSTRSSDEQRVRATTALCFADPSRANPAVVAATIEMTAHRRRYAPDADESYLAAARSIVRTLGRRGGLRTAMNAVTAPVLLLHGDRDRLVPVESARIAAREHPAWTTQILPGLGHTPMLEDPELVGRLVEDWLAAPGSSLGVTQQ